MIFKIKIVDYVFEVNAIYESTKIFCKDYLSDEEVDYQISIGQDDIDFEKEKDRKERIIEKREMVSFNDSYLETLALYRKIVSLLVDKNVVLFHGSAVEVNGDVFLFTAKSGTGKSTHVSLYKKLFKNAIIINDDKPLLKFGKEGIWVYGTPWAGKHNLQTNKKGLLKAICILAQASDNRIEEVSFQQAYSLLLQQSYRFKDKNKMIKSLNLINKLKNVSLYHFYCNKDDEAALISYERMK